jgi:CheY-like chemotaxis protein
MGVEQFLELASRIRQVFQNLIGNAIHHGGEAPVIAVHAEEREREWYFAVSDNGPGVDESLSRKIFEPFSRQSKHNGLGMGLAICKRIVEGHGGRIWCESGANGGAVFAFVLPKDTNAKLKASGETNASAVAPAAPVDETNLATILVVDDNEASIELARIVLIEQSKLRCRILSAGSGEEAINLLNSLEDPASVDLVLLDINMPRMDGFEVLTRIGKLSKEPKPPVVMCSTSSYDKDKERAQALGACGYLEKPPQLRHLQPILTAIDSLRLDTLADRKALRRVA